MNPIEIAERGYAEWAAKPHNAKWVQRIEGTPIPNDLKVCIAMAFKDALSAERARVIEECARVADNYGREGYRLSKEYACEMADELAARIRALGQQDTGGADDPNP